MLSKIVVFYSLSNLHLIPFLEVNLEKISKYFEITIGHPVYQSGNPYCLYVHVSSTAW